MSVFIIAEAGVNHNGDINLAKKLIDAAAACNVDAVKFQTFSAELSISKHTQKAEYQKMGTDDSQTQFDMVKKLELSYDEFKELKEYCDKKGVLFLSTPDEIESADFLSQLQDIFKIGSAEITNLPLLRHIGALGKKIVLSTGMATMDEIKNALEILIKAGTKRSNITLLHATTEYPTLMQDVNLKAMITIGSTFNVDYGYSDHTLGIEVPIAAVAMGAKIIEKHFTLDKAMEGPDHQASLNPQELKEMVKAIRNIETALGDGIKTPTKNELKNIDVCRKSIVARVDIKEGDIFSNNNLTIKKPGDGMSPMLWESVINQTATKDYKKDEQIRL
ncbi:MAG: N-acetylneuraminate synthase [Sulfurimonas sp. RIFOXYD12_FULL_33_39]|uniref:N-acetylneuraminate synthase n=1 Tax=unclassified Sulfurimonas TaxID=2623549 RepID=UPI0008D09512|nr:MULTISPECIES: N-acetylneuraminate synthase [unclassified Sulfurimonas]OHE10291.1 MAG: N-acetylneuraminate synthase [Sulfurimonas sp. RIFOXYD12_FULL_33_39]OHE13132.1 MAG: N-acetylneuraminate synthase [Sulfurimonas sp. RIFOXYD2_FULL_34_21]DAB27732.1 MAG TPA: N-acetylneuraminate synthase [Sulfurimonas sp. UBA10385]